MPGRPPVVDLATWQAARDELLVREKAHTRAGDALAAARMWYDGAPHQGQCEGCTLTVSQLQDASYLDVRGVSFAVVTSGLWDEVAPFVEFMGYTRPWYSARDVPPPVGGAMGDIVCYLRDGDRTFLTYRTSDRGTEPVNGSVGLLDMTPYGRGEAWEDNPDGWPTGRDACWLWRSDADGTGTGGPTSRPAPQWLRPGATPRETLGRKGSPR